MDDARITYTFSPLPGVTLTNAFLVSQDVLEGIPLPCFMFTRQGDLIWRNRAARDSAISDDQHQAIRAAITQEPPLTQTAVVSAGDAPPLHLVPVRNLLGVIEGVLAYGRVSGSYPPDLGLMYTGYAIYQEGHFVVANSACVQWMGLDITGLRWNQVPGLPDWSAVAQIGDGDSMVDLRAGYELRLRGNGGAVVIECVPHSLVGGTALHLSAAAEMVHEIRNPLAALSGFVELALRRVGEPEVRDLLAKALMQLGHLESIAANLLWASKPLTLEVSPIPVQAAISQAWELVDEKLRGAVEMQMIGEDAWVEVDPAVFQQILVNVLKNAVEAMEGQGTVKCSAQAAADGIAVSIADTGKGFPEGAMAGIFERNFTTKPGGSGLGLLIVRRLMMAHGGQIGLSSSANGTVIELKFPAGGLSSVANQQ